MITLLLLPIVLPASFIISVLLAFYYMHKY